MKTHRNPSAVHPPIAKYSHQIEITEPTRWLVLSGQVGQELDGSVPIEPIQQLDIAFRNVTRNLEAAQMTMQDVVKLTIYLVGEFDVAARRAVIGSHLHEPWPCVTMVFIAGLADPMLKVEIEAWACCS